MAHSGECEHEARRVAAEHDRNSRIAVTPIEILPREEWRFHQAKTSVITDWCPNCKLLVISIGREKRCGWCDTPVRQPESKAIPDGASALWAKVAA